MMVTDRSITERLSATPIVVKRSRAETRRVPALSPRESPRERKVVAEEKRAIYLSDVVDSLSIAPRFLRRLCLALRFSSWRRICSMYSSSWRT